MNPVRIALRLLGLAIVDAFAMWFVYQATTDGVWFLATIVGITTLGINVVFLREGLYPLRWLSPGLALIMLMVIYPLIFTVYAAFTNYSFSHLLTKQQAIRRLEQERYLESGAASYHWTAFRSPNGEYAIWLVSEDGQALLAYPGQPLLEAPREADGIGPLDEDGIPQSIEGYEQLSRADSVRYMTQLSELELGESPNAIRISSLDKAAPFRQRFSYDSARDVILDHQTGTVYEPVEGTFTSSKGETLRPGFQVGVGWKNFQRIVDSPALRGPLARVFLWTIVYALLAVLTSFALGLFLALVFNDPTLRARKFFRSTLLVPYAVPYFISILVWRGLLNPHLGIVNRTLDSLFDISPPWFSDPLWAKVGVLLVNLWLGFPYMMLITTGALQGIPAEISDAAAVDGATPWQRFWHITLPLLLISMGPLLIFSFAFNFNNFTVIYLFNRGGPPIPNTPTPAGHTDILISYGYRLAFDSGLGDYGYASAIMIVIFLVLAAITLVQFRYTRIWEEVSENV